MCPQNPAEPSEPSRTFRTLRVVLLRSQLQASRTRLIGGTPSASSDHQDMMDMIGFMLLLLWLAGVSYNSCKCVLDHSQGTWRSAKNRFIHHMMPLCSTGTCVLRIRLLFFFFLFFFFPDQIWWWCWQIPSAGYPQWCSLVCRPHAGLGRGAAGTPGPLDVLSRVALSWSTAMRGGEGRQFKGINFQWPMGKLNEVVKEHDKSAACRSAVSAALTPDLCWKYYSHSSDAKRVFHHDTGEDSHSDTQPLKTIYCNTMKQTRIPHLLSVDGNSWISNA